MAPKNMLVNRNEEMVMPVEDIAGVVASSYDRRFPPKNVFRHTHTHSSSSGSGSNTNNNSSNPGSATKSTDFNSISMINQSNRAGEWNSHNESNNSNGANGHSSSHNADHHSSSNSANISRNNSNNSLNSNIVVPVAQRRASKGDKDRIKGWLSTGLVPQFLHVSFFEKWEIKKVSGDDAIHY